MVLSIGIRDYAQLDDAPGADADARLFAAFAEQTMKVPADHIRLIVNEQATKSVIDAEIGQGLKGRLTNDLKKKGVIVYFAGRGASKEKKRYLLPREIDPHWMEKQGIDVDEIKKELSRIGAAFVLLILDTNFGASTARGFANPAAHGLLMKTPRVQVPTTYPTFALVASKDDEGAATVSSGHGRFSYHLFQGLNGKADQNDDKRVTLEELSQFIQSALPPDAGRAKAPQTPVFEGDPKKITEWSLCTLDDEESNAATETELQPWLRDQTTPQTGAKEVSNAMPTGSAEPTRTRIGFDLRAFGPRAWFGAGFVVEPLPWLSVLLEGGYMNVSDKSIVPATMDLPEFRVDVRTTTLTLLARARFRPWPRPTGLAPLIDVGAGFAFIDIENTSTMIGPDIKYKRTGQIPIVTFGLGMGYRSKGPFYAGAVSGLMLFAQDLKPSEVSGVSDPNESIKYQFTLDDLNNQLTRFGWTSLYGEVTAGFLF